MNPKERTSIHLSNAVAGIAMQLQKVTVRVSGSRGRHGSGTIWSSRELIMTNVLRRFHLAEAA